ncbi:MAG: ester cyclase, partial [Parvibaculales bacterium]
MSKPILRVATTHMDELLNPGTERRMDLPGFDEEFVDLPHYIIKITDRIWHERQVETIHDYYNADCPIHTLGGDVNGAAQVIQNTYDTLASFPDRRLDGDNVIWSDDGNGHFYSSHLISSKMTNLGESEFGPATGRKILAHTIADCLCHENRIVKEWLVRDYAGIVIQMGRDIDEAAAKLAEDDAAKGFDLIAHHAANRAAIYDKGALQAQKGDTPLAYASRVLADVWQAQNIDALATYYFDRARIRYPADKELYGSDQLTPHLQDLFDAFPDM